MKLKDVRWALGVEACLKRLMYSFRCHDQHDASVLKDIMNRLIPQNTTQPSIITSQFEVHKDSSLSQNSPFLSVTNKIVKCI